MKKLHTFYLVAFISEIVLAFICAPYSCEWGANTYFNAGALLSILCIILPFFTSGSTSKQKFLTALLFGVLSVIIWCIGFLIADVKIMCRLF